MSPREVAAKYRVSESWVRRLKQRRRETGSIEPTPQRHGPLPSWLPHAEAIAEAIRQTRCHHRAAPTHARRHPEPRGGVAGA